MEKCIFIYKKEHNGRSLYECSKCGYLTYYENAERQCVPMVQSQFGEPSLTRKIGNFSFAMAKHLYKGMPTVTEAQLNERLKICHECPLFKQSQGLVSGVCTHESCGCNIGDEVNFLNKIAWADQKCPIGRWKEIESEPGKNFREEDREGSDKV